MFSGIVEELGRIREISARGSVTLLEIEAAVTLEDARIGDSIAVNGACLTVIKKSGDSISFEVMPQTFKSTNLGGLKISEKVNLERSLKVGGRLSGHFVTGHVDCIGTIRQKRIIAGNQGFEIAVPSINMANILPKGSVAVDGISLTVAEKRSGTFIVYIIPHTFKNTTLGFKGSSAKVNIETDILTKRPA